MKTSVLLAGALVFLFLFSVSFPVMAQEKKDRGPISWVMEDLPNYVVALKKVTKDPATGKDKESYLEITITKDTQINILKPQKGSFRDLQPGTMTTDITYVEKGEAKSITILPR